MALFVCFTCKKKFTTLTNLMKHRKLKHAATPGANITPLNPYFKKFVAREQRIEKHRQQQVENKTGLEEAFIRILEDLGLNYTFQYVFGGKVFDFHLTDYNVLVEANGDFWHSNPKLYKKPKYKSQRMSVRNDKQKKLLCESNNQPLIVYWESDVMKRSKWVKEDLKKRLGL
jgi:G:T-mismatch repair DNA endonuclease (very short patch repair protein)